MRDRNARLLLRSLFSNAQCSPTTRRRWIHQRREFENFHLEKGLPPFLSPDALRLLAVDYQQGLLDRLNDLVKSTPWELKSLRETVIETARDRTHILAFNTASEALNNAYFLSRLTPHPQAHEDFQAAKANPVVSNSSKQLFKALSQQYSSLTTFQDAFSSAALGMSGSGYLWLVLDAERSLGIVGTYGSGTVLIQDRMQRGGEWDVTMQGLNAPVSPSEGTSSTSSSVSSTSTPSASSPNTSGTTRLSSPSSNAKSSSFSSSFNQNASSEDADYNTPPFNETITSAMKNSSMARASKIMDPRAQGHTTESTRSSELHPLFCLSISPNAWLTDYGVWGKEPYLENFWKVLDWEKVHSTYNKLMSISGPSHRSTRVALANVVAQDRLKEADSPDSSSYE